MTTREDSIAAVVATALLVEHDGTYPVEAAIEQALKDERIRTLEAVGCRYDGSCPTILCPRCRMLAEARGETA